MGTKLSWKIAVSTVYPVVTVTVNGCQILHSGIAMIAIGMVNFYRIIRMEVKSTLSTLAFLPLDGSWNSCTDSGVCAPSFTPVSPVSIVGGCCAFHFDMTADRSFSVF
jgi:hypothetical protein